MKGVPRSLLHFLYRIMRGGPRHRGSVRTIFCRRLGRIAFAILAYSAHSHNRSHCSNLSLNLHAFVLPFSLLPQTPRGVDCEKELLGVLYEEALSVTLYSEVPSEELYCDGWGGRLYNLP